MKRSLRSGLVAGSLGLAAACTSGPVEIKAVPDPAAYASCPSGGSARVTGATFARQRNGGLVSGAGRPVFLDPATRYSAAVFRAVVERQEKAGSFKGEKAGETVTPDPVMLKCRQTVQVDVDGKFAFANVPPGNYFLSSYISWIRPDTGWIGMWNVRSIVVPDDGKAVDVVLSGGPATIPDPAPGSGR